MVRARGMVSGEGYGEGEWYSEGEGGGGGGKMRRLRGAKLSDKLGEGCTRQTGATAGLERGTAGWAFLTYNLERCSNPNRNYTRFPTRTNHGRSTS